DGITFTQFNNIDIFINQNKDLFYDDNSIIKSNAFVINNDIKSYIHDSLFFNLQFDDSSEIVSFNDAFKYFIFDIDCIDTSNPGIFTFDFEYLTFALNFAITVRANIIQSIEVKSSDNTNSIVFKEGIELDSLNINILASFNDADNNPIEAKTIIDIKDVLVSNYSKNEIYEFSNEHMDANGQFIERVINFSYLGKSSSLNAKIYKKALERLVLKVIPKKIYIEQEDTDIDFTGGIVTIEYDNGYKFDKDLTSLDLIKDVSQFSTNVELNNGSRKEYSIKISYTDGEYTRYTNYVVYVVDRKYIEIEYSDSVNNILNFEYESSDINNRPEFLIKYYTDIESNNPTTMSLDNPNLKIYYIDATTNQIVKENDIPVSWPENVGSYILCVEFLGDAINNPFISKFYTINITKKILNIVIDDIDLIYGNIYQTLNYKNLGLNISLFDSLENDYSSIYNSLVTSENFVLYRDVTKNNIVEFGHYPEVAPVMTAINLDYGTYLLETIVTIDNDANYTLNKLTIDSNINVVKRSIKVYANEKIKQYGDEDPLFDFYVEDNTTSGLNNNVSLIGDNNTISFKYNDNIIFTDSQISLYRLIRDTSIANQAVNLEGYPILSGQSYDVPNYDVEYIGNVIKITKSNLFVEIKDNIISNDFGTINISFDYLITNSKYQDNTASLLYDYLSNPIAYYDSDLDKVIYVNEITSNNINTIDYCLIKNLRSNNYPVEFSILSGTNYLMIPISTIAGTYDLVLNDISVVLSNYNVLYSNDNVSLVVNPIRVNVNIISKFVSEKTFKDTNNNYVYNHFAYPGINFSFNEINETNLLIGNNAITPGIFAREDININYDIQNYILSDNFILDNLHLTSDTCVGGINGVTCEYNSLSEYKDSFLISFTSMYSDNMSYIDYYFSILNENLFSGQLSNNFVDNYNLYYIYIPSLIDLN
ncbi:MAG: hypothetical protein K5765_05570, partial [Clostridia bacterium]|nr:hypothetical protein [Clostridia bacterium]